MSMVLMFDKQEQIRAGNSSYIKRFGTMFVDFKTDRQWYCFQFYPLFLVRRLVFVTLLIVMTNYPEVQCNCFTLFCLIVSLNGNV